jgi:hypothetical protein
MPLGHFHFDVFPRRVLLDEKCPLGEGRSVRAFAHFRVVHTVFATLAATNLSVANGGVL